MSDFEDIQNLIRLKRHEQPPPEFVEQFVKSFKERQRAELLNQSARGLLWERLTTYFDGLFAPKWGWAAATAAVLVGTFAILQTNTVPAGGEGAGLAQSLDKSSGKMAPISYEEYKQYLLGDHYRGGFGDEREGQPQTADSLPRAQGGMQPAGGEIGRWPHGFRTDIQQ